MMRGGEGIKNPAAELRGKREGERRKEEVM